MVLLAVLLVLTCSPGSSHTRCGWYGYLHNVLVAMVVFLVLLTTTHWQNVQWGWRSWPAHSWPLCPFPPGCFHRPRCRHTPRNCTRSHWRLPGPTWRGPSVKEWFGWSWWQRSNRSKVQSEVSQPPEQPGIPLASGSAKSISCTFSIKRLQLWKWKHHWYEIWFPKIKTFKLLLFGKQTVGEFAQANYWLFRLSGGWFQQRWSSESQQANFQLASEPTTGTTPLVPPPSLLLRSLSWLSPPRGKWGAYMKAYTVISCRPWCLVLFWKVIVHGQCCKTGLLVQQPLAPDSA